jgi:hypothetical protein
MKESDADSSSLVSVTVDALKQAAIKHFKEHMGPSFFIRRAAVTALMATPDGSRLRPEMEAVIPKDQHFVIKFRKVHVLLPK